MQEVQVRRKEFTDKWDTITGSDVGDQPRTFTPVDEKDVEVVVIKQETRCI